MEEKGHKKMKWTKYKTLNLKSLIKRLCVQGRKKRYLNIKNTKPIVKQGKLKLYPSQLECEWDGETIT